MGAEGGLDGSVLSCSCSRYSSVAVSAVTRTHSELPSARATLKTKNDTICAAHERRVQAAAARRRWRGTGRREGCGRKPYRRPERSGSGEGGDAGGDTCRRPAGRARP